MPLVRPKPLLVLLLASVSACASSTKVDGPGGSGGEGGDCAHCQSPSSSSTSSESPNGTGSSTDASSSATASGGGGGGPTTPTLMGLRNTSGWQIYDGGQYRYGPSIIVHPDASIDLWTCSPGANGAWDYVRYRHSTDGGHSWSEDVVALQPTPGARDAYSTCDPGAVKIGDHYYIGYTSTENAAGTQNDLYLARSTSPGGPFEKWSGNGWGNAPQPIVTYGGDTTKYGIGEPSLLVQGGKLFIYYTDDDATGNYTDLAVVDDPTVDDWPSHLNPIGHVITHGSGQDSIDVKYVDSQAKFLAVSTFDRFSSNSTVVAYESTDGQHFDRTPFFGARVQSGAHNLGISGDETGHIDTSKPLFIAYAYAPVGSTWGDWPTYLDPITVDTFPLGTVVGGDVSSIVGTNDWNWSGPRAWDGDAGSLFSSDSHGATDTAEEWAFVDLGRPLQVASVTLTPRGGGFAYPVDFSLQSSSDGATWTDIPGCQYTGHPAPSAPETLTLPSPITSQFIRVDATRLGADDNGNHYLQLAEIQVGLTSP